MVPAPGRSKDFQDRKDICFVGGFRHIPNVDAVLFFVKEVWPLVRKTLPKATFKIIGAEAPEEIVSLASDSVQILGHVQDLSTIFDSIKLSVAPIRYGAGVKGKVVLSMGLGVPVAGTPLAFEGMDLDLGKEALSGATPEELAMQIARLYTDSALWTTVSNAAVARAKREYSEEVNLPLIRGYLKAVGLSPREHTVGNLLGRVERQVEIRS
jgi:glycosyltransferase involved in cell wall biosynthesis